MIFAAVGLPLATSVAGRLRRATGSGAARCAHASGAAAVRRCCSAVGTGAGCALGSKGRLRHHAFCFSQAVRTVSERAAFRRLPSRVSFSAIRRSYGSRFSWPRKRPEARFRLRHNPEASRARGTRFPGRRPGGGGRKRRSRRGRSSSLAAARRAARRPRGSRSGGEPGTSSVAERIDPVGAAFRACQPDHDLRVAGVGPIRRQPFSGASSRVKSRAAPAAVRTARTLGAAPSEPVQDQVCAIGRVELERLPPDAAASAASQARSASGRRDRRRRDRPAGRNRGGRPSPARPVKSRQASASIRCSASIATLDPPR